MTNKQGVTNESQTFDKMWSGIAYSERFQIDSVLNEDSVQPFICYLMNAIVRFSEHGKQIFSFSLFLQAERFRQLAEHLESLVRTQESQLVKQDEEQARLAKKLDQREVVWEQREVELESRLVVAEASQVRVGIYHLWTIALLVSISRIYVGYANEL